MKTILASLLLLASSLAWADEASVNWDNPMQNCDGSVLEDLAEINIHWGPTPHNSIPATSHGICGTGWSVDDFTYPNVITGIDPDSGPHVFTVPAGTWYITLTAVDSGGDQSLYSGIVTKVATDTSPLPPSNVSVAGSSAFIIVQGQDRLVLLDIGTVTADTVCDPNTGMRDDNGVVAYKIPVDAVTPYSPSQEMVVVFSSCGN